MKNDRREETDRRARRMVGDVVSADRSARLYNLRRNRIRHRKDKQCGKSRRVDTDDRAATGEKRELSIYHHRIRLCKGPDSILSTQTMNWPLK